MSTDTNWPVPLGWRDIPAGSDGVSVTSACPKCRAYLDDALFKLSVLRADGVTDLPGEGALRRGTIAYHLDNHGEWARHPETPNDPGQPPSPEGPEG